MQNFIFFPVSFQLIEKGNEHEKKEKKTIELIKSYGEGGEPKKSGYRNAITIDTRPR